jgi:hypothetical protein
MFSADYELLFMNICGDNFLPIYVRTPFFFFFFPYFSILFVCVKGGGDGGWLFVTQFFFFFFLIIFFVTQFCVSNLLPYVCMWCTDLIIIIILFAWITFPPPSKPFFWRPHMARKGEIYKKTESIKINCLLRFSIVRTGPKFKKIYQILCTWWN